MPVFAWLNDYAFETTTMADGWLVDVQLALLGHVVLVFRLLPPKEKKLDLHAQKDLLCYR